MTAHDPMVEALEELKDAILADEPVPEAVAAIATAHGVKASALHARASREGGLFDSVERLKREAQVAGLIQKFVNDGLLVGCPRTDFSEWCIKRSGVCLTEAEGRSTSRELARRLEQAQWRFHQKMMMGLGRANGEQHVED